MYLGSHRTKLGNRQRRWWREGGWPREIYSRATRTGLRAGAACTVLLSGYDKQQEKERSSDSHRFCTMCTTSNACGRRISPQSETQQPESTAKRGSTTARTWRLTYKPCRRGWREERIGRSQFVGCTYQRRMGGYGRSECRHWKTKSSSDRRSRYAMPYTRWTFSVSRTDFDQDAARIKRWMHSRSESRRRR